MKALLGKLKKSIGRKIKDHPSFEKMLNERDQLAYWKVLGENMSFEQKVRLKIYNLILTTFVLEKRLRLPKEVRWAMRQVKYLRAHQKISKLLGWRK